MNFETRYKSLPRTDRMDNQAAEIADYKYGRKYGELALRERVTPFEEVAEQVNKVYREMGAKIIRGVSYAGEDPTDLWLPTEDTTDSRALNMP